MQYEFSYNGKSIPYEIIRKNIKNINIRVKPDGVIVVSCNEKVDNKIIELEMIKRANWIINTVEQYKTNMIEFVEQKLRFVDGESFLLFGRVLQIKNVYALKFSVMFDNNYLYINRENNKGIKAKFNEWYNKYVNEVFLELVNKSLNKFEKYGISEPTVLIKKMKTRWGTCNTVKKIITLNIQLAKVDPFLSEYVICHELTHLKYRNHTKEFYNFLTVMVPDWKQREKILNSIFINEIGGFENDN